MVKMTKKNTAGIRALSRVVILPAIMAALILPIRPVAAATTVTYDVAGVEYARTPFPVTSSSAGAAVSGTERGVWNAVIESDLGGITGGTFTFRSMNPAHNFDGTFESGTLGPATGGCAKTTIPVAGQLSGGGTYDVTLTRYGKMWRTMCVVYFATVRGSATLAFA